MKKKIIAIVVCAVLAVGTVAGILIGKHLHKKPADIHDTPIPASISVEESQGVATTLSAVDVPDLPVVKEEEKSTLLGNSYRSITHRSEEDYKSEDGLVYAETAYTEYFSQTDALLYTAISRRSCVDIYGADGTILYSAGTYVPEINYDADSVRWFYKDGNLAGCELYFADADSGNFGAAYYDAKGNLLCLFTEIYSVDKSGKPSVEHTYYNASFETIEEADYQALIPQVDAPQFLYQNWA